MRSQSESAMSAVSLTVTKPWRVVMFSVLPSLVPLVEQIIVANEHKLVGIVTAPGPRTRRTNDYLEIAQLARPGVDVIVSNYPHCWAAMIAPLKTDLLVCVSFNWKIPSEFLDVPPLGAINGHDGLLPRYRGLNATGWALRNDEPAFAVTVHFMPPELDDGPVLAQRAIPITDDDDRDTLISPFVQAGREVYQEALNRIAGSDRGVPQREADEYLRIARKGYSNHGRLPPGWAMRVTSRILEDSLSVIDENMRAEPGHKREPGPVG